jgi:hypothetical protein
MSDRTYCILILASPPTPELMERLTSALGEPTDVDSPIQYGWEEVNYGSLPEAVESHLIGTGTPFAWRSGRGDEYDASVMLFDPAIAPAVATFHEAYDGSILLTLDEATDSARLAAALRWNAWLDDMYNRANTAVRMLT